MQTKLIDGAAPRAEDHQILAAVLEETRRDTGAGFMVVGVRNEAGQLYRVIHAYGLAEFVGVTRALRQMQLKDELADESSMREGCDAIFAG